MTLIHRPRPLIPHRQLRLWAVGLLWVAALLLGLWALGWAPVAFR